MWSSIQKFGLEHCDLETMLWNVSFMLRTLTINIDNRYKKGIPIMYYISTLTLAACYYFVFLVCMAWVVAWRTSESGDWIGATIVASLGITSEIGTTKFIYMILYIRKIRELVDLYRACDSLVEPGSRFAINLKKKLRVVKKRAIFFWMVLIGNGFVYASTPLFRSGRHFMEDNFTLLGLEPKYTSPNYEITHLLMLGGLTYICYVPANISAFLIIIAGYTEAQLTALSEEMLHIWPDAQKYYRGRTNDNHNKSHLEQEEWSKYQNKKIIENEYIKQRLLDIVKIHTTNIYIVQKVERVYRGSIAVEFILLTFGITVELLGRLENTFLQIPFALMQVAMDCLCGQRMMEANEAFEAAVYACKWENFDVTNMKTALLMLQMSQKTLRLSAGGVTMLNFTSLGSVLRIIYSGYNALRQLY